MRLSQDCQTDTPATGQRTPDRPKTATSLARGRVTFPAGAPRRCAIFIVDIRDFTAEDRDDLVQLALRRFLYGLLSRSFNLAGIPWRLCVREDRGDGVLIVLPVPVPVSAFVPSLVTRLDEGLHGHNQSALAPHRLRLRSALHFGTVHRDSHGMTGDSLNRAFRLVDSVAVREALDSSTARLALIVSDEAYRELAQPGAPIPFRSVVAEAKKTQMPAWLWTGGQPSYRVFKILPGWGLSYPRGGRFTRGSRSG